MNDHEPPSLSYLGRVTWAAGITAALLLLVAALWYVSHVLLLVFAAIMFAIILDALANLTHDHLPIPRLPALIFVIVFVAVILPLVFWWLIGTPLAEQISQLFQRLPQDIEQLVRVLESRPWGRFLLERVGEPYGLIPDNAVLFGQISGIFSTAVGAMTTLSFVILIGFYLALHPGLYVKSVIALVPLKNRERAREIMDALGHALRWWLIGRLGTMTAVGVLTALGFWAAGIPLALALGVITGLFAFVPYIGALASGLLALLVAWGQSPLDTLYVLVILSVVQFLEGNFITPMIQKRVVSLPPAALLAAMLFMGVLFGLTGVLLATPLTVAVIVLVQMIYVESILGDRVQILGEHPKHDKE